MSKIQLRDTAQLALKGYTLIEASAGTGKTFTITSIYLRLVMEEGRGPEEILVVTFTNAATQELRTKIRQRLSEALARLGGKSRAQSDDEDLSGLIKYALERVKGDRKVVERRLRSALLGMDQAAIYTIHGFCQRVLNEFAFDTAVPMGRNRVVMDSDLYLPACRQFVRTVINRAKEGILPAGALQEEDGGDALVSALLEIFGGKRPLPEQILEGLDGLLGLPEPVIVPDISLDEACSELAHFISIKRELAAELAAGSMAIEGYCLEAAGELVSHVGESISQKAAAAFEKQFLTKVHKKMESETKALSALLKAFIPDDKGFKALNGSIFLGEPVCPWLESILEGLIAIDGTVKLKTLNRAFGPDEGKRLRKRAAEWLSGQGGAGHLSLAEAGERIVHAVKSLYGHRGIAGRLRAAVLNDARRFIRSEISRMKSDSGALSYDDMLVMLKEALSSRQGRAIAGLIRHRYKVALIDEFQDTDRIQWEIFRSIYPDPEDSRLFLIGDPKQAIYGFRGADIFTYLEAKDSVPAGQHYNLEMNWRSSPELVDVINRLFDGETDRPFVLEGIEFVPVAARWENAWSICQAEVPASKAGCSTSAMGAAAELWLGFKEDGPEDGPKDGSLDLVELTACEIERLISLGAEGRLLFRGPYGATRPIGPGDIAILVGTHDQARKVQEALEMRGIYSVTWGPNSVFSSHEAKELSYILRAVADPSDARALTTALGTAALGYTAQDILELKASQSGWDRISEQFTELRGVWQLRGVLPMLRLLFERFHVPKRLHGLTDGARRLTNLRQLSELLARAEGEHPGMERLLLWLCESATAPRGEADEQRIRLETDENLVQIMTYHMSKGLEFPVVFLPFIQDMTGKGPSRKGHKEVPRFYSTALGSYVGLVSSGEGAQAGDIPGLSEDWRQEYEAQMRSEGLRLLYVALTRAKYKLYLPFSSPDEFDLSLFGQLVHARYEEALKDGSDSENGQRAEMLEKVFSGCSGLCIRGHDELIRLLAFRGRSLRQHVEGLEISLPSIPEGAPLARQVWVRASFSAVAETAAEGAGHEGRGSAQLATLPEGNDIFSFPRGPVAGNVIHRLLEIVDFRWHKDQIRDVATKVLEEAGFDPKWAPVLCEMVGRLVSCEFIPGLTLNGLDPKWIAKEMEFHWPFSEGFTRAVAGLGQFCDHGVMKGFIDLLFMHDGRFYVLDYKTNWLGPSTGDYNHEAMAAAMDQHNYWLQAAIYSRAVHAYLKASMPGYSCKDHFGGSFYIFVRGIAAAHARAGILFLRPEDMLSRYPWIFDQDL